MSLVITIRHYFASLVMPNGDSWDKVFYHTLTPMIDSYIDSGFFMLYVPVNNFLVMSI